MLKSGLLQLKMMTTPLLNLIFMQGFNLDLELPSRNDCLIILCEMIIQACVLTAGWKKWSSERKMRIREDYFFENPELNWFKKNMMKEKQINKS